MTDKELIELAARAVGIKHPGGEHSRYDDGRIWDCKAMRWWNPLVSDGDALRLASDLRLAIKPGKYKGDGCSVESQREGVAGCTAFRDSPYEQMRRAIVIVAAEVGKGTMEFPTAEEIKEKWGAE